MQRFELTPAYKRRRQAHRPHADPRYTISVAGDATATTVRMIENALSRYDQQRRALMAQRRPAARSALPATSKPLSAPPQPATPAETLSPQLLAAIDARVAVLLEKFARQLIRRGVCG